MFVFPVWFQSGSGFLLLSSGALGNTLHPIQFKVSALVLPFWVT